MNLTRKESSRYRAIVVRLQRLRTEEPGHPSIPHLERQLWALVDKIISEDGDNR